IDKIHGRVVCFTDWLLEDLVLIRHSNGSPLVRICSPTNMTHRGGTIAINFHDPNGNLIDHRRIAAIARDEHISLRTGCFCNPDSGETAHGLTKEDMAIAFQDDGHMTFDEFLSVLEQQDGKRAGAVRVSLGVVTNFADGFRFSEFVRSLLDRKSEGI
ncbi:MAG: cysteine desulfurase, partial [Chloroflexota bacterium]|nr:cysteine desulfurase [Chloroflexota bacterium]